MQSVRKLSISRWNWSYATTKAPLSESGYIYQIEYDDGFADKTHKITKLQPHEYKKSPEKVMHFMSKHFFVWDTTNWALYHVYRMR